MGPGNLCSRNAGGCSALPHCFIGWIRERNWGRDPRTTRPGRGWCRETLFLGSSEICPALSGSREGLPCTSWVGANMYDLVHVGAYMYVLMRVVHGVMINSPLQGVNRFESPQLSVMSGQCSLRHLVVINGYMWILLWNKLWIIITL